MLLTQNIAACVFSDAPIAKSAVEKKHFFIRREWVSLQLQEYFLFLYYLKHFLMSVEEVDSKAFKC